MLKNLSSGIEEESFFIKSCCFMNAKFKKTLTEYKGFIRTTSQNAPITSQGICFRIFSLNRK